MQKNKNLIKETVQCSLCRSTDSQKITEGLDYEYMTSPDSWTVVGCNNCGLHYLNPRPSISELDTIYPKQYNPYHFDKINPVVRNARDFIQKTKVKAFFRYAPSHATVMDVGCGNGALLLLMKAFGKESWTLLGNDFSEHSMKALANQGIQTVVGPFESIQIGKDSIDLLTLNQVIEHFDDPQKVFQKAHQILKPGGHIFIETPSLTGWDAQLFSKKHWGGYHFPRHWHFYTPNTLQKHLESNGFEIVETTALASPSFWVQSCHHWCYDNIRLLAPLFDFKNPVLMAFFTLIDLLQKNINMTSNMRMVARKKD